MTKVNKPLEGIRSLLVKRSTNMQTQISSSSPGSIAVHTHTFIHTYNIYYRYRISDDRAHHDGEKDRSSVPFQTEVGATAERHTQTSISSSVVIFPTSLSSFTTPLI